MDRLIAHRLPAPRTILAWAALLVTLLLPLIAQADLNNENVFDDAYEHFRKEAKGWAEVGQASATSLFVALATISLVWTAIQLALRRAELGDIAGELVKFSLFTGFFGWLLRNGPEHSEKIIKGMLLMGGSMTGANGNGVASPSGLFDLGFILLDKVENVTGEFFLLNTIARLCAISALVALALVANQMLKMLIAGWFVAFGGVFILGFGGAKWTSDMAVNYYKTCLSVGFHALANILLSGAIRSFIDGIIEQMGPFPSFHSLCVVMVVAWMTLGIMNTIPAFLGSLPTSGGLQHHLAVGSTSGNTGIATAAAMAFRQGNNAKAAAFGAVRGTPGAIKGAIIGGVIASELAGGFKQWAGGKIGGGKGGGGNGSGGAGGGGDGTGGGNGGGGSSPASPPSGSAFAPAGGSGGTSSSANAQAQGAAPAGGAKPKGLALPTVGSSDAPPDAKSAGGNDSGAAGGGGRKESDSASPEASESSATEQPGADGANDSTSSGKRAMPADAFEEPALGATGTGVSPAPALASGPAGDPGTNDGGGGADQSGETASKSDGADSSAPAQPSAASSGAQSPTGPAPQGSAFPASASGVDTSAGGSASSTSVTSASVTSTPAPARAAATQGASSLSEQRPGPTGYGAASAATSTPNPAAMAAPPTPDFGGGMRSEPGAPQSAGTPPAQSSSNPAPQSPNTAPNPAPGAPPPPPARGQAPSAQPPPLPRPNLGGPSARPAPPPPPLRGR